ncbi:DUF1614 domain-containing protein [Nitrosococcus oceani]|uniref:DUF1614 domain-containing protein n=1 Tax=Nitrosococcus oceani C-27 TaxID=314279 RepID=A0A0E2ZR39_9GAMM|nr:DUF1614 domain-containing protein [Nitrosococcus oceani]KFI20782.1 hypothetical protein IB75_01540 [Nitrosococcus oceani C-27]GEM20586.1 hypothetical protein NONS58_20050 [Nitrosococcus oceani]
MAPHFNIFSPQRTDLTVQALIIDSPKLHLLWHSGNALLSSSSFTGLSSHWNAYFYRPLMRRACAQAITPERRAPLAYIAGTLEVLLGADILRLKDIRRIGTPITSIGGAGTFDGIFITSIIAALLA